MYLSPIYTVKNRNDKDNDSNRRMNRTVNKSPVCYPPKFTTPISLIPATTTCRNTFSDSHQAKKKKEKKITEFSMPGINNRHFPQDVEA